MNFLNDFIKGIIIGIGAIAPGVSGDTFAVILGVYDKLTDAIANIFCDFKNKLKLFLPLGLGILVGILGFSNILDYLFTNYEFQVTFLFIGLMLGTIDSVINEANKKGFRRVYLLPCIIAFIISVLLMALENGIIDIVPESNPGLLDLMIYGGIIGFGSIVPGISSSFILMAIGAYEILIKGLSQIDLYIIIPVVIGFSISILLLAKIVTLLFKKYYGYTYYTVLGFVLGSIVIMVPKIEFNFEYILGIIICVIGFFLSHNLSRYDKNRK